MIMAKEINIAEILKDMPEGTKLWTPILGKVAFNGVYYYNKTYPISVQGTDRLNYLFTKYGRLYMIEGAEMLLFPSKEMRDWSKVFKEGDVLENTSDNVFPRYVLFEKFIDDKYTTFEATTRIIVGSETVKKKASSKTLCLTPRWKMKIWLSKSKRKYKILLTRNPNLLPPNFSPSTRCWCETPMNKFGYRLFLAFSAKIRNFLT